MPKPLCTRCGKPRRKTKPKDDDEPNALDHGVDDGAGSSQDSDSGSGSGDAANLRSLATP